MKALLASYGRSVLAAASALYLAGVTDPVELAKALLAGLIPVAIRYINPKDQAFGKVAEQVVQAYLPQGEAVIPKEYLEKNKEAIEKLVKEYNASAAKKDPAKAAKAPAKKPATKK
jgi:hypothetical protein